MTEIEPQGSTVTKEQAANANGAYDNFVSSITSSLCGQFPYGGKTDRSNDFGYPSFFLERDIMGQDIFQNHQNWFDAWYTSQNLGPTYANSQLPWTVYFKWIKSCNTVISLAGDEPDATKVNGAGIAYAMRALYYLDMARMFAPETYAKNKEAETIPIITDKTSAAETTNNPRATNQKMYEFILSDLDKAEKLIANYKRQDVYTPNLSVVYGLKARAYLTMEDWANARKYAKMAQEGYTLMNKDSYTSRNEGFNKPTTSWMLGCRYKSDDPGIILNDGDTSWGSQMILEIDPKKSGCGYGANYGQFWLIDRHLYETIPATDFRRNCFVDFAIDKLSTKELKLDALKDYTDYPDWVYNTGYNTSKDYVGVGGLPLKFRAAGGLAGRENQMIGWVVAVPMMRVEEMYLIEAEAAGMMNEGEGIALLTAFAKTRDASYTYGNHNEAYGNTGTKAFQNECWWQRRVEFWGEGLATFDIKRLNKGIIRSYPNSNHINNYRWNTPATPQWMTLCIVQTETNYNKACTNNPDPVGPTGNSPEHQW